MIRFPRTALMVLLGIIALAGTVRAESSVKPAAKTSRFAREYRRLAAPTWKKNFPHLRRFEVLGPSTPATKKGAYNCIANTLKISNRWVWPGKRVADFDRLYGSYGYKRSRKLDFRRSARFDKIVLYGKVHQDGKVECTHGARQLADGTWTSKLGAGPLIRHSSLEAVGGPSYGKPIAVYYHPRRTVAKK